jgi:hypothetical protein
VCLPLQALHPFKNIREIFLLYKDICKYPLGECQGLKWLGLRVLPGIFFFNKKEVPNKLKCKNITHMVPFSKVGSL